MNYLKSYISKALAPAAAAAMAGHASAASYFPHELISETANFTPASYCSCGEETTAGVLFGLVIGLGLASGYYILRNKK